MNRIKKLQNIFHTVNEPCASAFLGLLFCGDLAFVILHCIYVSVPTITNPLFSIERDKGYAEIYQYIKFFWIIVLLAYFSWKNLAWRYSSWVLVFSYFLVDDALQIHEKGGELIASYFSFIPPLGLRLQDFGELAISAFFGFLLIIPLLWAYFGGSRPFRYVSRDIALLIAVLVVFGVFVDLLHVAIDLGTKVGLILGLIEDGGEMLSVSLLVWYMFVLNVRGDADRAYLHQPVRIVP